MNRLLLLILVALAAYSCSTTKSLSEGEVLYTGSNVNIKKQTLADDPDWKIDNFSDKVSEVYLSLWDAPNGSLFGQPFLMMLPVKLWIYNFFYDTNNSGFNKWTRKNFGEAPITISDISPELKTLKAINVWENFGHFGTTGNFEIKYNNAQNKARIKYILQVAPAYHYRNVLFENNPALNSLNRTFQLFEPHSLIHSGDEFYLEVLKNERTNIWKFLQNNGYYFIQETDLKMEADTTVGKRQIDLKSGFADNLNAYATYPQYINSFSILINDSLKADTTGSYYEWNSLRLRKRFVNRLIPLKSGELYSLNTSTRTQRNITETGLFYNTNLQYQIEAGDTSKLNTILRMKLMDASTIEFNVKGNYENIGYIGPSVGMNFTQLNVFRGAENLTINSDAYYNFPTGAYRENVYNSSGVSVHAALTYPWLNSGIGFIRSEYALPKQIISLNTDFNDRKEYFRLFSWSAGYGLVWKSSPNISHRIQFLNATYSNIFNTTEHFDTLVTENPSLRESLVKQFILSSGYTFTYDGRNNIPRHLNFYFEGNIEQAGNTANLIHWALGNQPPGKRKILGLTYSQFVRLKYDFRMFYNLSATSQLAFRHIGGIGYAFGNSSKMPYIREFFIGGSNSLRPISARTIGPGRYIEFRENEVNQVGDLKLEFNFEYRFKLFWKLNGALWSDAGNIWLLKEDPTRPGGEIRWNHIFEDSYLTAGAGARLDLNFVMIRFDYGAVLYLPIFDEGYRWLWQNKGQFWYPVISFGLPF